MTFGSIFLSLVLFSSACGPAKLQLKETVDLIELNHVFLDNNEHGFDQVIVWEWDFQYRRYNIRSWAIVRELKDYPRKVGDRWVWRKNGRNVVSSLFRETFSNKDPEIENSRLFPHHLRNPVRSILVK